MWAVGLRAARRRPGLLTAATLADVSGADVAATFRIARETVADPGRRAVLWRDLARGLLRDYSGAAAALLELAGGKARRRRWPARPACSRPRPAGEEVTAAGEDLRAPRLARVADPEHWQVSADNVLMRLALRSGLVATDDDVERVRAATRDVFARVAAEAPSGAAARRSALGAWPRRP